MKIESQEDDSVTLTVGSITAHIRGATWAEANKAAHALGTFIDSTRDTGALTKKLRYLRQQVERISQTLGVATCEIQDLSAYIYGAAEHCGHCGGTAHGRVSYEVGWDVLAKAAQRLAEAAKRAHFGLILNEDEYEQNEPLMTELADALTEFAGCGQ